MAKRSRTRPAPQAPAAAPVSSRRTTRRRTVRRASEPTFLERYGSWLLGGLIVIGVGVIVVVALGSATQPAYACAAQLTPGPTEPNPTQRPSPSPSPTPSLTPSLTPSPTASASASPAGSASPSAAASGSPSTSPSASPSPSASASPTPVPTAEPQPTARLGFTTTDLGASHITPGSSARYAFCPPTSGSHYNIGAQAPMQPAVYGPSEEKSPAYWLHNLEHGYVIATYSCPSGVLGSPDCISQAELDQLTTWFNEAPDPPFSECSTKVLVVRFDQMDTKFGLLAWNRALLTDQFDAQAFDTFTQQWMEHPSVPERASC